MKIRPGVFLIITAISALLIMSECKKENSIIYNSQLPYAAVLTTFESARILSASALCGGNISSDGGFPITGRGVCWSTGPLPTTDCSTTSDGTGIGSFTSNINGLTPGTLYYLRAYATNLFGTSYGNTVTFITSDGEAMDIDGNIYPTVNIGTQTWMAANLRVTHYRNGDSIPEIGIHDGILWRNLTSGAYTGFMSDSYGKLYNWYAVIDNRDIAPTGWHVATDTDWTILTDYAGGSGIAGDKLKAKYDWITTYQGSDDSSDELRFSALGGSYMDTTSTGLWLGPGVNGYWWTSTENGSDAWGRSMQTLQSAVHRDSFYKNLGFSVRCIKD
ncbi:MAG: fibrobacter succinogenes major paralogous domain-containing protein [Bacteroidota bacterium]